MIRTSAPEQVDHSAPPTHTAPGAHPSFILMLMAALLVFNYLGRPFELVLAGYHIPAIIVGLAVPVAVFCAVKGDALHRVPVTFFVFIIWMFICVPTSEWRRGSFDVTKKFLIYQMVMLIVIGAAPATLRHVRTLVYTAALSCVMLLFFGTRMFNTSGRLGAIGTYDNPDSVGILAGFAIPLWLFMAQQIPNMVVRIMVALAGATYLVRCAALSGTRTSMLGLLVMLVFALIRLKGIYRAALLGAAAAGALVVATTIPDFLVDRLSTSFNVFDSDSYNDPEMNTAVERLDLWKDALTMTIEHPILGVGPGEYGEYRYSHFRTPAGRHKTWFWAHNSYLQVSAETGVPGLLLYLIFIGAIYKTIRSARKLNEPSSHPDWQSSLGLATSLEISFVFIAFCATFMNSVGEYPLYVLSAIAVALERTSREQIARASASLDASPPPPGSVISRAPAI